MSRVRTAALLCAGLAAAAVASTSGAADAATPIHHTRATVVVRATPHTATAPRTMHPGLVHVRNGGSHAVVIIKSLHGATVDALVRESNDENTDEATFEHDFALVDLLRAHHDMYARFTDGRYFVLDAATYTVKPAMVATVRVAGAVRNAVAPRHAGVTISRGGSLVHFTAPRHDRGYVRVSNKSKHIEVVYTVPVRKSVSDAALKRFITHPSWQRFVAVAKTGELKDVVFAWPGRAVIVNYTVPTGRNLIFAMGDGTDNSPGLAAGHVRAFTTS
jgi:hypothetical protein